MYGGRQRGIYEIHFRIVKAEGEKDMTVEKFGETSQGKQANLYVFENKSGMVMSVSDYGATLVNVMVPDKTGKLTDVVLGFDDVTGYERGDQSFGATVGRNANRIGGASFTLNGSTYELEKNDGENNLHSGPDVYNKRFWRAMRTTEKSITLVLDSKAGDQGYPGNLNVKVTYALTDENEIRISYEGHSDADTIFNLTNHSYFNLDGEGSGNVLKQKVWIHADAFTMADAQSIPTGEIRMAEGTPMDFRKSKIIGKEIDGDYDALKFGMGYDHNWILNAHEEEEAVAGMEAQTNGIKMEVYTDLPGMQFYTGNFLNNAYGKHGHIYHKRSGACFETQFYPDAVNHPEFPQPVLKAGEVFRSTTAYKFFL